MTIVIKMINNKMILLHDESMIHQSIFYTMVGVLHEAASEEAGLGDRRW